VATLTRALTLFVVMRTAYPPNIRFDPLGHVCAMIEPTDFEFVSSDHDSSALVLA
jgi:hypothetical protein